MIYFQLGLIFLWLFICSAIGLTWLPYRWGDLNIDRDITHIFARWGLRIARIKVAVEGMENHEVHQPCIYVSNHQSGMDILTVGSIFPSKTIVIGKKELYWVPIFGIFFKGAGNILIDRKRKTHAVAGLQQATDIIKKRGASIWIFPEGTRNRSNQPMLPFKKGAFHMAIAAGVPIVPIVSAPLTPIISWKEKRLTPGTVRLRILPPISTSGYTPADVDRLASLVREKMLEAFADLSRA